MYARRAGIGETALIDPLVADPMSLLSDIDNIMTLVPTVTTTPGGGGSGDTLPAPSFAPAGVSPLLVTGAPAPVPFAPAPLSAPVSPVVILMWVGVALFAAHELTRRRR